MWITSTGHFDCSPDDSGDTEYKVEIQKESEDKIMRRGMITSIDTVTQVYKMFRKKKKENMGSIWFSHFLFLRHRIICWPGPLPKG